MPEDPAARPPRPRPATAARYLQALKVPAVLLGLGATALLAYYWLYVQGQEGYFIDRNFRMLATASHQLEQALESAEEVVRHLSRHPRPQEFLDEARRSNLVPILSLVPMEPALPELSGQKSFVPVLLDSTSTRWEVRPLLGHEPLTIPLGGLLSPLLAPFAREDLFDSVVLATTSGRALLQTGDRTLRLTSLANLLKPGDATSVKASPQPFPADAVARSANAFDVVIANRPYRLFVAPCCAAVHDTKGNERGWLVAGLVSRRSLRSASLSVSFSLLALLIAVLLLAVFSWPFVKLLLIGPLQRVRFFDVLLVGFCTLFGGALVTIAALDFYAYSKLKADLDGQLEAYAESITANVATELEAATKQLEALVEALPGASSGTSATANLALRPGSQEYLIHYPMFESFSLIDDMGMQRHKWALGGVVTPLISVAHRAYFAYWQRERPNETRFVESIRSQTTGNHEVVISKRTRPGQVAALSVQQFRSLIDTVSIPGFGFAIVDRQGKLLFHSKRPHEASEDFFAETDGNRRLRALVEARQRGWLTLRYGGDEYRAYASPLRLEDVPDWSLITFFDKQLARTVNVDWLMLASLFMLLYAGAYVVLTVAVHLIRPKYRAPWVWPAADLCRAYIQISIVLAILTAAWLAGFAVLSSTELLWTAWLLPFVGWAVAYCCLAPPRAAHPGRIVLALAGLAVLAGWFLVLRRHLVLVVLLATSLLAVLLWSRWKPDSISVADTLPVAKLSYGASAAAMAVLTIVLPAASFYKVAHTIQTASMVKYGQLRLALAVNEREVRSRVLEESEPPVGETSLREQRGALDRLGLYHDFFYKTEALPPVADGACGADEPAFHQVPEKLEELLPFYSELSVGLRELTHDRAYDGRWQWCGRDGSLLLSFSRPAGDLRYRSELPVLFGSGPQWPASTELLAILLCLLAVAAFLVWAIRFIVERLLLIDLIDPLWSARTAGPVSSGPNLLMVTRKPLVEKFFQLENYTVIDLGTVEAGDGGPEAWERDARSRLTTSEDWRNVLVLGVDRAAKDDRLKRATLRLLEYAIDPLNRTVLMVSTQPPSLLGRSDAPAADDAEWEARWTRLLATFVAVPVGAAEAGSIARPAWAHPQKGSRLGRLLWRLSMGFLSDEASDVYVLQTWSMLVPSARAPLEASQLLVEADERLDRYYRRIWRACLPDEQLVLLHIAEEGVCNQKNSRIVRRLMARGLVTRRRNIRLVSETFRRFVLSEAVRADAAALEGQSTSAWDQVRVPFLAILVASLAFFFTTQQELYNATIGVVAATAAAVPTILKLVSLFGEKRSASS